MRVSLIALFGFAIVMTACGNSPDPVVVGDTLPAATQPIVATEAPAEVEPVDASVTPDPRDDLVFKPIPVPVPVQPPRPKPVRSLPTPPPAREAPADPTMQPDEALIASAIADLAYRLDGAPAVIEVLDARRVTWRDGSLGCPQPDLAYSQALVEGWLVVLRVDNASYRYHASIDGEPFHCATPQGPLEGSA